jgi:hypothetical protein
MTRPNLSPLLGVLAHIADLRRQDLAAAKQARDDIAANRDATFALAGLTNGQGAVAAAAEDRALTVARVTLQDRLVTAEAQLNARRAAAARAVMTDMVIRRLAQKEPPVR